MSLNFYYVLIFFLNLIFVFISISFVGCFSFWALHPSFFTLLSYLVVNLVLVLQLLAIDHSETTASETQKLWIFVHFELQMDFQCPPMNSPSPPAPPFSKSRSLWLEIPHEWPIYATSSKLQSFFERPVQQTAPTECHFCSQNTPVASFFGGSFFLIFSVQKYKWFYVTCLLNGQAHISTWWGAIFLLKNRKRPHWMQLFCLVIFGPTRSLVPIDQFPQNYRAYNTVVHFPPQVSHSEWHLFCFFLKSIFVLIFFLCTCTEIICFLHKGQFYLV